MLEPPPAVCRALYEFDPSLRLCYIGVPFETPEGVEPEEGVFGLCALKNIRERVLVDGTKRYVETWVPWDIEERGVRVFNKSGRTTRDYDPLTHVPVLIRTISSQWNMSSHDVYGSFLVDWVKLSPRTQKEALARKRVALVDEGKEQRDTVRGIGEEFGKALYKDLKAPNSNTDRTVTREERIAADKRREERKALNVGLKYYYAWRKGL